MLTASVGTWKKQQSRRQLDGVLARSWRNLQEPRPPRTESHGTADQALEVEAGSRRRGRTGTWAAVLPGLGTCMGRKAPCLAQSGWRGENMTTLASARMWRQSPGKAQLEPSFCQPVGAAWPIPAGRGAGPDTRPLVMPGPRACFCPPQPGQPAFCSVPLASQGEPLSTRLLPRRLAWAGASSHLGLACCWQVGLRVAVSRQEGPLSLWG